VLPILYSEPSASHFDTVAHALEADSAGRSRHDLDGKALAIIRHGQEEQVGLALKHDSDGRCMRMAVNVDEGLLRDAKERHRDRFIDARAIADTFENGAYAGPSAEPKRKGFHGSAQAIIAEFDRIMEIGDRPDFPVDKPNRILDFLDQVIVLVVRLDTLEVGNAQLQRNHELACRVVQFLAEALTLIFVNPQEAVELIALGDGRTSVAGFVRGIHELIGTITGRLWEYRGISRIGFSGRPVMGFHEPIHLSDPRCH
jgi:hypothetical protein